MVSSNIGKAAADAVDSATTGVGLPPERLADEEGALARLLEAERERVTRLAAADREAEALLAEARAWAAQREAAFLRDLEIEITELRQRLEVECAQEIADLETAARSDAARFDGVTEAELAVIADRLLDELFSAGSDHLAGAGP